MNVYDGVPFRKAADASAGPVPHEPPLKTVFGVDSNDYTKLDLTEPLQVAAKLHEWGVAFLNVTMGNPYANPHVVRPAEFPPVDGYHAPEHPLIGVFTGIFNPQRPRYSGRFLTCPLSEVDIVGCRTFAIHAGAGNFAEKRCSLVGLGRATLSQPDFVKQLMEHGHLNRKTVCRTLLVLYKFDARQRSSAGSNPNRLSTI